MITANQLVAHAVGDYVLQSDWMANEKTKRWAAVIAHVVTYALPFLFLTQSWKALCFIVGTHLVIDHWRLARYVCWLKNFMSPRLTHYIGVNSGPGTIPSDAVRIPGTPLSYRWTRSEWHHPWSECADTGYHKGRPPWMAVWLMIITDNVMHVICNGIALRLWG